MKIQRLMVYGLMISLALGGGGCKKEATILGDSPGSETLGNSTQNSGNPASVGKEDEGDEEPGGTGGNPEKSYVYLIGWDEADKKIKAYNPETSEFTDISYMPDGAGTSTIDMKGDIYYTCRASGEALNGGMPGTANSWYLLGFNIRTGQLASETPIRPVSVGQSKVHLQMGALEFNPNDKKIYAAYVDPNAEKSYIGSFKPGSGDATIIPNAINHGGTSNFRTFDPVHNKFITLQVDYPYSTNNYTLREVDIANGNVSNTIYNLYSGVNYKFLSFDYNVKDGLLYGFLYESGLYYLASMDMATGSTRRISKEGFPDVAAGGHVVDPVNGIYYGFPLKNGDFNLVGISLETGETVHNRPSNKFTGWELYITKKPLGQDNGNG
jgi:hypothetical protein